MTGEGKRESSGTRIHVTSEQKGVLFGGMREIRNWAWEDCRGQSGIGVN